MLASQVPKCIPLPKCSAAVEQSLDRCLDPGQRPCRRRYPQHDAFEWCTTAVTSFNQLPWISALDHPDQSGVQDFADLSQLDHCPLLSQSGLGPIRRSRKVSSKPSPRRAATENDFDEYLVWMKSSSIWASRLPSSPRTPRNLRAPLSISRVHFHNLMPVVPPPVRPKCESDGFV